MPDMKEQVNRVERTFVERGLQFDHNDTFENPMLVLNFGGGDFSYPHVSIHLIFDADGESAHLVTSPIGNVPVEKTSRLLLTLNEYNCKFRWVKFYLDSDNDVVVDDDVTFDELNAGEVCVEAVVRMANIIDEAYGDIMKGIWG